MKKKCNIFLIGPMGAGKSTVGKKLAKDLRMDFFDSDQEIEKRTGADISWVFDVEGETNFRIREKKIIDEVTKNKKIILATGGGSVISRETRSILCSRGIVIYLKINVERQLIRTQYDNSRPLLLNKKLQPIEILKKLAEERNPLYQEIADITIEILEQNVQIIVNDIISLLKKIN